jgi:two-component system sensor histidine kinase YesM
MRFSTHRNKLIANAVFLMLFAQITFVLIAYLNVKRVSEDTQINDHNVMLTYIQNNVLSSLKDLNALATRLSSSDFTSYPRAYLNLREEDYAATAVEELNKRLSALEIPPQNVKEIYLLGENINQKSFLKTVGEKSLEEGPAPWLEEIRNVGLIDAFLGVTGLPVFYDKGELTAKLNQKKLAELSPMRRNVIRDFISSLEGHLVVNNGIDSYNVMSIIVFQPEIFTHYSMPFSQGQGHFVLLDKKHRVILSNMENHGALGELLNSNQNGLSVWKYEQEGQLFHVQKNILYPYEFTLIYSTPIFNLNDSHLLKKYLFWSFAALIVTFLVAYLLSGSIYRPLRNFSNAIQMNSTSSTLKEIRKNSLGNWSGSSITVRHKIMLVLLFSVIIPAITAGILHSWFMYTFSINQLANSVEKTSKQMSLTFNYKINLFENLSKKLSVDGRILQYLIKYKPAPDSNTILQADLPVSLYPELSDVSYFVVYNSLGVPRYSSIFLNNISLFSNRLSILPEQFKDQSIVWIPGMKDVFGRSTISLIKKIEYYLPDNYQRQTAFLELVLEPSAFNLLDTGSRTEYMVISPNGNRVYENGLGDPFWFATNNHEAQSGDEPFVKHIEGREYLIAAQSIDKTGWTMYVFQPLLAVLYKNAELVYRYILVIVTIGLLVFMLSWLLSRLLVRPIEHMENMMKSMGDGYLDQEFAYEGRDEVGGLVRSFNRMVKQINHLMDENISNKIREQELTHLKTKAELGMLQQQINPHFLYNTLEAISMRARRYGAVDVSAMVSSLSKIFRFSISFGDDMVRLKEEIEHTKNYISIQKIRFPEKFSVEWDVDESVFTFKVPKLILQPLVENAVNHGIAEYTSGGVLKITAKYEQEQLLLKVEDNGVGMPKEKLDQLKWLMSGPETETQQNSSSKGVGIFNVYRRLNLYYQNLSKMTVESVYMEGTRITIYIPIREI